MADGGTCFSKRLIPDTEFRASKAVRCILYHNIKLIPLNKKIIPHYQLSTHPGKYRLRCETCSCDDITVRDGHGRYGPVQSMHFSKSFEFRLRRNSKNYPKKTPCTAQFNPLIRTDYLELGGKQMCTYYLHALESISAYFLSS